MNPCLCELLLNGRTWAEWRVGNEPLAEWLRRWDEQGWRDIPENAWISHEDLRAAERENSRYLVDSAGEILARREGGAGEFLANSSLLMLYPWDMLRAHEICLSEMDGEISESAEIHESFSVNGSVTIGANAKILPGVVIEGRVVIGANAKIGPNCYLAGHVAIGDGCRVGQGVEIKNSQLGEATCVAHLSYVGDSILGNQVNLGGGTILSNYRHDACEHRALVAGKWWETGRVKWGAVLGDGVRTGIQTAIYPGRILAPGETTLPAEVVKKNVGVDEFLRMREF